MEMSTVRCHLLSNMCNKFNYVLINLFVFILKGTLPALRYKSIFQYVFEPYCIALVCYMHLIRSDTLESETLMLNIGVWYFMEGVDTYIYVSDYDS